MDVPKAAERRSKGGGTTKTRCLLRKNRRLLDKRHRVLDGKYKNLGAPGVSNFIPARARVEDADVAQIAFLAFRALRRADVAAVEEEPVVGEGDEFVGDVAHEGLLHLIRRVVALVDEAEAVADAEDVGVDGHGGLAEGDGLDNVGRLAAHTRETEQLVHVGGHLAVEALGECAGGLNEVARLGVGVGYAPNILVDFLRLCLCHRMGIGEPAEEVGRHEVDALVGTLCTEDDGNEELEHAAELEFGVHLGHLLLKIL